MKCQSCYEGTRRAEATQYVCGGCGQSKNSRYTPAPRYCEGCSNRLRQCSDCGAPIDPDDQDMELEKAA